MEVRGLCNFHSPRGWRPASATPDAQLRHAMLALAGLLLDGSLTVVVPEEDGEDGESSGRLGGLAGLWVILPVSGVSCVANVSSQGQPQPNIHNPPCNL